MKMKNWTLNTNKVRAWAENQQPSDNLTAVLLSLQLGDNAPNDELRSTYWRGFLLLVVAENQHYQKNRNLLW